jgi:hypothetical protein
VVKKKYPEQAFVQKARLTKDDKVDDEKDRLDTLEAKSKKRGKNWSTSRLTSFFEIQTGLKGTTKMK